MPEEGHRRGCSGSKLDRATIAGECILQPSSPLVGESHRRMIRREPGLYRDAECMLTKRVLVAPGNRIYVRGHGLKERMKGIECQSLRDRRAGIVKTAARQQVDHRIERMN